MSVINILDKTWYYYLVEERVANLKLRKKRSLLSECHNYFNYLIVCWVKDNKHLFTYFTDYLKFIEYELNIHPDRRSFFEIIFGHLPQKPHFDLDIDNSNGQYTEEEILGVFIPALIKVFSQYKVDINLSQDILIYSSHGKTKLSFHIIVDNHCHNSSEEAKALYYLVLDQLPEKYRMCVDPNVYSSIQQFRMLGSQKEKSGRVKIFHEKWKYQGEEIIYQYKENNEKLKPYLQFQASLVSLISHCLYLPIFEHPAINKSSNLSYENVTINSDEMQEVLHLFCRKMDYDLDNNFPFNIIEVKESIILFQRIIPTECPICKRIHEHENPYLLVTPNKDIFFDCRRAPAKKRLYIGSISQTSKFLQQWRKTIKSRMEEDKVYNLKSEDIRKPVKKIEMEPEKDTFCSLSHLAGL